MNAVTWLICFALLVLVCWLFLGFDVPDRLDAARAARHAARSGRRG